MVADHGADEKAVTPQPKGSHLWQSGLSCCARPLPGDQHAPRHGYDHGRGLAGALPFLINWIHGTQVGTVAPFLDPANLLATSQFFALSDNADAALFADAARSIAGLEPWLPIWQAAGLSALGHWLSWPLQWLAIWIVYGVAVLAVSHLFGAHTTLQHFFAGTSYACLPLLLLAFIPIPVLGGLAALVAAIWALIVYVLAVETVAKFDIGRAIVSVLAPGVHCGRVGDAGTARRRFYPRCG